MAGESQETPGTAPDPTVLTTEALDKAIANSEKLTDAKLDVVQTKGQALHNICIEKFKSMESTFGLVERQRVEQKKDTKDAVDAALAAAKEAVKEQTTASDKAITKSEEITKTQLTQLSDNFATSIRSLESTLGDLKDRLVKIESRKEGATESADTQRQNVASMVAVAAVIIAALSVAVSIILIGN